jgi:hypothetical protein
MRRLDGMNYVVTVDEEYVVPVLVVTAAAQLNQTAQKSPLQVSAWVAANHVSVPMLVKLRKKIYVGWGGKATEPRDAVDERVGELTKYTRSQMKCGVVDISTLSWIGAAGPDAGQMSDKLE